MSSLLVEYGFFVLVHVTWITAGLCLVAVLVPSGICRDRPSLRQRVSLVSVLLTGVSIPAVLVFALASPSRMENTVGNSPTAAEPPGKLASIAEASPREPLFVADAADSDATGSVGPTSPDPALSVSAEEEQIGRAFLLKTTAMLVYSAGALWCLLRLLVDAVRVHRCKRDATPVPQNSRRTTVPQGFLSPPILASNAVETPVLLGFWKPAIVLPNSFVRDAADSQINAVVLHEFAHFQRRDHVWLTIQRVVQALLFFHPSLFLLGRQLDRERELLADRRACRLQGASATQYAKTLVEVAAKLRADAGDLGMAFLSRSSPLTERVRSLIQPELARPGTRKLAVTTGLVATGCVGLVMASPPRRPEPVPVESVRAPDLRKENSDQETPPTDTALRYVLLGRREVSLVDIESLLVRGYHTSFELRHSDSEQLVVEAYEALPDQPTAPQWSWDDAVSIRSQGNELTIKDIRGPQTSPDQPLLLRIHLPRSLPISLRSFRGNLEIHRPLDHLSAEIWSGEIRIGPVDLHGAEIQTSIGTIISDSHRLSDSSLHNTSGEVDLRCRAVSGAVELRCGSGPLRCTVEQIDESASLTVTTNSGDIAARIPNEERAQCHFQTKTGTIHVNDRPRTRSRDS